MKFKLFSLILLNISFWVAFSIDESVIKYPNNTSNNSVAHILLYGRAGVGKSFVGNRLRA
jgi:hypothetical protein